MDQPDRLRLAFNLTRSAVREAIGAMELPRSSRGLDAGCGIGLHAQVLAEAVGAGGRVIGLDVSEANLAVARRDLRRSPQAARVELLRGDLGQVPFAEGELDWVWCADTLWPVPGVDPRRGVAELARVVRPGGRVGLLFFATQVLLGGYPALEARLDAAHARQSPYLGAPVALQPARALAWLEGAGLERASVHTFTADLTAPLDRETRGALAFWIDMLWGEPSAGLSATDRELFGRICLPDSPEFVGDQPGYAGFLTYRLFVAHRPAVAGRGDPG